MFLGKIKNSDDRDCVIYMEFKGFECDHYFAGLRTSGACFSGRLNEIKDNIDNFESILTKEELLRLFELDKMLDDLGYGIEKGSEKYNKGIEILNEYKNTIGKKLESEENKSSTSQSNTTSNKTNSTTQSNQTSSSSNIKIEVINGSGESSKLQEAVNLLKKAGYDVTKTGTTSTISTTIITNRKSLENSDLNKIKETLGVGSISTNKSSTSKVDVQIIIGKDFGN